MRQITGIAAIVMLFGQSTFDQLNQPFAHPSKEFEAQILRLRDRVWRAWFADDETALRELVSEDAVVISAGEKDWKHREEVLREAREFREGGGLLLKLTFPRTAVQRSQDAAFIYSDYVLEISTNGKRTVTQGRVTEAFVLRGGKWLNAGWHTDRQ